jgi:hypothetical protein
MGLRLPLAFPDFERFCSECFLPGTPIEVCCVYRFRHVRMRATSSCRSAPDGARAKPGVRPLSRSLLDGLKRVTAIDHLAWHLLVRRLSNQGCLLAADQAICEQARDGRDTRGYDRYGRKACSVRRESD